MFWQPIRAQSGGGMLNYEWTDYQRDAYYGTMKGVTIQLRPLMLTSRFLHIISHLAIATNTQRSTKIGLVQSHPMRTCSVTRPSPHSTLLRSSRVELSPNQAVPLARLPV